MIEPSGLLIFTVTYLLISARRLKWLGFDRPAGALLGATACVFLGVLSPREALDAVDASTLLLLFSLMGIGAFLDREGFFGHVENFLERRVRTPHGLLAAIVWGAGVLSAFLTNDAVCVLGAPLVVRWVQRHELPAVPFLLALATAANTGSVATLVGNPQNMLCAHLGGLRYADHLGLMAPVALLGLALNHAVLVFAFRSALRGARLRPPRERGTQAPLPWVTLAVVLAIAFLWTLGTDLAWTATAGFVALMLLHRIDTRTLWARIDWTLLLFFAGLFIVVRGFEASGAPAAFFARWPLPDPTEGMGAGAALSGIFLLGSNIVSNVPFILVVRESLAATPNPELAWELLAMASTFAGNLTLLGSVANIIVAESAREVSGFSFLEHLRVGLPIALLTTAVGTTWVLLL